MDLEQYIQIDKGWVGRQLQNHFNDIHGKVNVKLYTVKVSGTTIAPGAIVEELHNMLPNYVYGKKKINELGELKAGLKANHFFGKRDPKTDGKYGELLLFALVESVLG